MSYIDVVFDGPPGPAAGRFVEVEDFEGRALDMAWIKPEAPDKLWRLRIPLFPSLPWNDRAVLFAAGMALGAAAMHAAMAATS